MLSAARLEAQILSEMALAHEAEGRFGEADALLREGLALTELRYPASASVNAGQGAARGLSSPAAASATRRWRCTARSSADVTGERGALVGLENQIRPYFTMLVEDLPQRPELVGDLFLAAQLIERPGAAQTLSQLARQLSAGTGEASDLFRRATAVDRELTRANLQIAQIQAQEEGAAAALLPELEDRRMRLEQMQLELFEALSAYPEYRSVAHNYVTADGADRAAAAGRGLPQAASASATRCSRSTSRPAARPAGGSRPARTEWPSSSARCATASRSHRRRDRDLSVRRRQLRARSTTRCSARSRATSPGSTTWCSSPTARCCNCRSTC